MYCRSNIFFILSDSALPSISHTNNSPNFLLRDDCCALMCCSKMIDLILENTTAGGDGTDLSKGLAAYMAGNDLRVTLSRTLPPVKQDDDMSISSSDTSSKRITPGGRRSSVSMFV